MLNEWICTAWKCHQLSPRPDSRRAQGSAIRGFIVFLVVLTLIPQTLVAQVDTAWVRTYDGPQHGADLATAMAIDNSQNVYITGYSMGLDSTYDYTTIKYSASGATIWERRYEGNTVEDDRPYALAVDRLGNVFVTGQSGGGLETAEFADFATIKYSPLGDMLWVRRYNGPGSAEDGAWDIAVNDSGDVYVTGGSTGTDLVSNCTTIKYSASGNTLWVRHWDGDSFWGATGFALVLDEGGSVFVTGQSRDTSTDYDIAVLKYTSDGDLVWENSFDHAAEGKDRDFAYSIALDNSGGVIVGGHSWTGTSYDFTTLKYSIAGTLQWARHYNGTGDGHDQIADLAVDSQGNIYVTGSSVGENVTWAYATIRYSPSGDTDWIRRHDEGSTPRALILDSESRVYVTGIGYNGTNSDYATVSYSSTGDTLWTHMYNGSGDDHDYGNDLALDDSGNIYVTGWSESVETGRDFATVKYIPCTSLLSGDLTRDETLTAADIIALVNFVFKSGGGNSPCELLGDVNCSGSVTSSDIIFLVSHLFKNGPAPCDA